MKFFLLGIVLIWVCYFPATGAISNGIPLNLAGINIGLMNLGEFLVFLGVCQLVAGLIETPWTSWRRLLRWGLRGLAGALCMLAGGFLFTDWLPILAFPLVIYFDSIRPHSLNPSASADVNKKMTEKNERAIERIK